MTRRHAVGEEGDDPALVSPLRCLVRRGWRGMEEAEASFRHSLGVSDEFHGGVEMAGNGLQSRSFYFLVCVCFCLSMELLRLYKEKR